jgi:Uma2 family endonuclease
MCCVKSDDQGREHEVTITDAGVSDAQTRLDVPRSLRLRLTRNGLTVVPVTHAHLTTQRRIANQIEQRLPDWEPVGQFRLLPRREGYAPEPDVTAVPAGTQPPGDCELHEERLPFVVEVVSPESADRDYHTKADHYALRGIPSYLVVNVLTGRWTLFSEPRDGDYHVTRDGVFGDKIVIPVEGLILELDSSEFVQVR